MKQNTRSNGSLSKVKVHTREEYYYVSCVCGLHRVFQLKSDCIFDREVVGVLAEHTFFF